MDEQVRHGILVDISEPDIQAEYKRVISWLSDQPFERQHITAFLDKADPWVIACAKAHGFVVVTQEQLAGPGTKKIKIPNICDELDVICYNTFDMLNDLNATF